MKRVVLDTNVLYSWAGLSLNDKLPGKRISALARKYRLAVSSPTLAEMVTKYRSDFDSLRLCLDLIFRPDVDFLYNELVPVSSEQMNTIYSARSLAEATPTIEDVINTRVDCELQFIHPIFVSAVAAISSLSFASERENDRERLSAPLMALLRVSTESETRDLLRAMLSESHGATPSAVKEGHRQLFADFFHMIGISVYAARMGSTTGPGGLSTEEMQSVASAVAADPSFQVPLGSPKSPFSAPERQEDLKRFLVALEADGIPPNYPGILRKNLVMMLASQLRDGAKMKRNDIMDMMVLCCVLRRNVVILTLDGSFRKRLREVHPPSAAFNDAVFAS